MNLRFVFNIFLLAALICCAGCAAMVTSDTTIAAGGVVYVWGELKTSQRTPLETVWSATETAIDDLQFTATKKEKQGLSAKFTAQTADGKGIHIRLLESHPQVTEISIRVGVSGNEAMSQLILSKIRAHL